MKRIVICVALVLFGDIAVCAAREFDREDPERDTSRESARLNRVRYMRVAAADRLIEDEDEIHAYIDAGFNTVVLYDTENGSLKSEERIAFETSFVRTHGLSIILGKATEPFFAATSEHAVAAETRRQKRSLGVAASAAVSDDEISDRLRLWDRYANDLIVGVFFLHDDAFYIRASVERQRHLYDLARKSVPDWDVFGMIGEFGFAASAEDVDRYFDAAAFDHLIMLMYPLNLGYVTAMPLDTISSADPDADMRLYVRRYIEGMGERFIKRLEPGQLTVLVVQAFAYDGEPAGHIPRPSDVAIEASLGTELLRELPGQEANRAVAYFLWDGARGGMWGLLQRGDWTGAAENVNSTQERHRKLEAGEWITARATSCGR